MFNHWPLLALAFAVSATAATDHSVLDNGLIGEPLVDCMEDHVQMTFKTEKPFNGRIFVKGMIDNSNCVSNYPSNKNSSVEFHLQNGECNMRRSRKLGPEQRGVEQSIVVIVSFHDTFITKVDRAYRCTCFYMEADKVLTNKFEVSCSLDSVIVSDLTYNNQANMAYAEVNVFKFADKVTTYFQCSITTCMISEGMCKGITPPRCGAAARKRRTVDHIKTDESMTMDIAADKIVVLDLEDTQPEYPLEAKPGKRSAPTSLSGEQLEHRLQELHQFYYAKKVCFSQPAIALLGGIVAFLLFTGVASLTVFIMQLKRRGKL